MILILIIAIQLIIPPNIGVKYYYLIIILVVFFINGGYNLIVSRYKIDKNQANRVSFYSMKNLDFSLFTSQMNNIAVATFIYFFYIHVIVMSNAIDDPFGLKLFEYVYRSKSYYMTYSEAEALHFWEYATIVLIPSSIVIRIINGLRKNNMP